LGFVLAIGEAAASVVRTVAEALGRPCPDLPDHPPQRGEALFWACATAEAPIIVTILGPKQAQQRHTRKYAEGALGEDRSFYFRGPEGRLNLRAQNLMVFLQMADGVDDATFQHHLRQGDYSTWFRLAIKDRDLARQARQLEETPPQSAGEARAALRRIVEDRYTAPIEGAV
jgi:hypothetical protein